MEALTRSQAALALTAGATLALAAAAIMECIAYAILSGPGAMGTWHNLLIAGGWVTFVGWTAILVGVAAGGWRVVLERRWADVWEIAAAAAATLVITVGFLVIAASNGYGSNAGNVVVAIGLGGWAALALSRSARRSLEEHGSDGGRRQADLWLWAAGALTLVAVAAGIPNASLSDQTLELTATTIVAVGLVALAAMFTVAHARGFFTDRRFPILDGGLWSLGAFGVAEVVVAAVVFDSGSLDRLRIGVPIALFIEAVAVLVLGAAAWARFHDLRAPAVVIEAGSSPPPGWYLSAEDEATERWWDGAQWTSFQRPRPNDWSPGDHPALPPLSQTPPGSPSPGPPSPPPAGGPPPVF